MANAYAEVVFLTQHVRKNATVKMVLHATKRQEDVQEVAKQDILDHPVKGYAGVKMELVVKLMGHVIALMAFMALFVNLYHNAQDRVPYLIKLFPAMSHGIIQAIVH